MPVQLIHTDNDSGRPGTRMGQGPAHILSSGVAERLRAAGHQVETVRVDLRSPFPTEIAGAFEIARALADQVRMASRQRRFPIVLAGNCLASVGAVAGHARGRTGVVWLDAHADFHTPETTRSGFLDGMALAVIAGDCWSAIATTIPHFRPVATADILLLATRDVEEEERLRIDERAVCWIPAGSVPAMDAGVVEEAFDGLGARTDQIHLHIDLDVLDPAVTAPANEFTPAGGLHPDQLVGLVSLLRSRCRLGSVTLSAYDPSGDPRGAVRDAANAVIEAALA